MQNIVILTVRLQMNKEIEDYLQKVLGMMDKVARNDASEAINNIIDAVSRHLVENVELQKKIYSMTLGTLRTSNEKLWHTICLRLGKVYLEQHNY